MKKKSLTKIYESVISKLLCEMTCPSCGAERAYVGFNTIECPNRECEHYFEEPPKASAKTDLNSVVEWCGLFGLSSGDGDFDLDSVAAAAKKRGWKELDDSYFVRYVDPKNWRVVSSPEDADNPKDVIQAGTYDEIYWEALSPAAKKLARKLNNPKQNSQFNNHDIPELDGRGHIDDVWETGLTEVPDTEDVAKAFGLKAYEF